MSVLCKLLIISCLLYIYFFTLVKLKYKFEIFFYLYKSGGYFNDGFRI